MNRIQFFYNDDLIALERKINRWLAANKGINIIETSLSAIGKPSQRAGIVSTEKYVFYIRYESLDKSDAITDYKAEEVLTSSASVSATGPEINLGLTKN